MKATAPGKIILFGEHAVVYGRPALAVPVHQVHAEVEVLASLQAGIWIHAPDIDLHTELSALSESHPIHSAIHGVLHLANIHHTPALEIQISSTIPVASGLGSGAAVSVALVRALALYLGHPLPDEQVNDLVFETEKLHHGTPSGIDNAVITYATPVFFIKDRVMETFKVGKPFTIVIADTGIPAPTKESVGDVRRSWLEDKQTLEMKFDEIARISLDARRAIECGAPEALGALMNRNHALLQQLTVSSPALDALVQASREAGAGGAKMSGGGRGGNMIALVAKEKAERVAEALHSAGARRTIIAEIK